jgi:hypothetical protein
MARITNILSIVRRAGLKAEQMARKQLSKKRGQSLPMNTFGLLSDSIRFKLDSDGFLANLTLQSYEEGKILDEGFSNIPFTPPQGKTKTGKKSWYIHSLAVWAAKKYHGGNYKQGLRHAFAIAQKQKQEGKSPANKGWISEIKDEMDRELTEILGVDTFSAIEMDVNRILNVTIP